MPVTQLTSPNIMAYQNIRKIVRYADYSVDQRNLLVGKELTYVQNSDYSVDQRNSKWGKEMCLNGQFSPKATMARI